MNPAPFVHSALAMTRRLKRRDRCPLAWLLDVWRWHPNGHAGVGRRCLLLRGLCCKTRLVSIAELSRFRPASLFAFCLVSAAEPIRGCLCEASSSQRWRGMAEKLGEPPEVLRGSCKQHSIAAAEGFPPHTYMSPSGQGSAKGGI
jgi:hypothetical protein